jgi:hypothetical protein
MPQLARGLRPVTTTTTRSASVKWALNRNYVHFAVDIVRAGEKLVGYVSLEEGGQAVECGGVGSSGTPVTIYFDQSCSRIRTRGTAATQHRQY